MIGSGSGHRRGPETATPSAATTITSSGDGYSGLAVSGTTVHIVHSGYTLGDISYYRSTDSGATFSGGVVIPGQGITSLEDPLACDGSTVGCLSINPSSSWSDGYARTGGPVSVRRSTDAGVTWGSAQVIAASAKAFRQCLTISGNIWNAVWMDWRNGYWDIYHVRSTDNGATWGTDVKLVDGNTGFGAGPGGPARPTMIHDGNDLYMAWMDPRDNRGSCQVVGGPGGTSIALCSDIYFKRSTDGGATWGADTRVTTNATGTYAGRPSLAVSGSQIILSYDYCVGSNYLQVGYKRSQDKGATWSSHMVLADGSADQTHAVQRFTDSNGALTLVMQSNLGGADRIRARSGDWYGASLGRTTVTLSSASAGAPLLAIGTGYAHVIYVVGATLYHQRYAI